MWGSVEALLPMTEEILNVQQRELPIERFSLKTVVPRNVLVSVDNAEGFIKDQVVVSMVKKIAYIPGDKLLWIPDGWWQAFKEVHFDFLLQWFPVKYKVYEPRGYLPDLILPGNSAIEMRWLEKTP